MNPLARSLFLTLLVWLGPGLQAACADALAAPQQVIRDTSERLHSALEQNRERLLNDTGYVYSLADGVFLPHLDLERISQLLLGRHWRTATETQKQDFQREFKHLMLRTYATALRDLEDWDMRFLPLTLRPDQQRTLVKTHLLRDGGPPLAVDYSMVNRDGQWLAYDVRIEGMSLVTNYRTSFARLIRTKGLDGLIQELATRNNARSPAAPRGEMAASDAS